MNSYQRDYLTTNLKNEKAVLKYIKLQYLEALKEVNLKISDLLDNPDLQSKIYQRKYQEALRKQLEEIIGKIDNYDTIYEYLNECYINGFVGTLYDIHKQGIPLMIPMNQQEVVYALLHETKLSRGLYRTLGWNNQKLATLVNQEISRGVASALSYVDVARNVQKKFQIGINNAQRIARTEGHRVQTTATFHAQHHAVDYGCDILKQWDSTLDARTRDSHREVDGELKELDEDFSNGLRYPGDPNGRPEEVINCRCALLSRPRWALGKKELDTLKERAAFHGLDKTKQFKDFEKKYLKVEKTIERPLAVRGNETNGIKLVNGESISLKIKNEIDKSIHSLNKKFPTLSSQISKIVFTTDIGSDIARAAMNKKTLEFTLKLNLNYFGNDEQYYRMINETPSTISKKNGLEGYLIHEYIHFREYQFAIAVNTTNDIINLEKTLYEIQTSKYANDIIMKACGVLGYNYSEQLLATLISDYAKYNDSEALAEACSYFGNDSALCNQIKKIVNKKWRCKL